MMGRIVMFVVELLAGLVLVAVQLFWPVPLVAGLALVCIRRPVARFGGAAAAAVIFLLTEHYLPKILGHRGYSTGMIWSIGLALLPAVAGLLDRVRPGDAEQL